MKRYYANLTVIKGICDSHSIRCIFAWQPSIYTVPDERLTEEEKIKKNSSYAKSFYVNLTNAVFSNPMSNEFNLVDMTGALKDKNKNYLVLSPKIPLPILKNVALYSRATK